MDIRYIENLIDRTFNESRFTIADKMEALERVKEILISEERDNKEVYEGYCRLYAYASFRMLTDFQDILENNITQNNSIRNMYKICEELKEKDYLFYLAEIIYNNSLDSGDIEYENKLMNILSIIDDIYFESTFYNTVDNQKTLWMLINALDNIIINSEDNHNIERCMKSIRKIFNINRFSDEIIYSYEVSLIYVIIKLNKASHQKTAVKILQRKYEEEISELLWKYEHELISLVNMYITNNPKFLELTHIMDKFKVYICNEEERNNTKRLVRCEEYNNTNILKDYNIVENKIGEYMICMNSIYDSNIEKSCYMSDGIEHGIIFRDDNNEIICDYINSLVNSEICKKKKLLAVECEDYKKYNTALREYNMECYKVSGISKIVDMKIQ